ncbi:MFS transporter [Nocardia sp. NPDC051756]|uniref:MFS transporter n=1 Tax=Nocardia sp. NPDC051756 TaxID=3154751 RepID=UPI003424496D
MLKTMAQVPGFRRLLLGRTLSFLATALVPMALTLAVIDATGRGSDLGIVLAAELLPQLVLLPIGGVLADRYPPQKVAFAADLTRGLAQLGIGIELLCGVVRITDLVILSAITGIGVAFGMPTMSPLVFATVPQAHRLQANSYLGVVRGVTLVAGPGVAGVLTVTVGAGWTFIATAVLFAVAACTLGGLRIAPKPAIEHPVTFFRQLADGWLEVRSRAWFWSNLIGHGVSNLGAGVLMTLGPLIAVHSLGGEVSWVLIYQAGMAGLVIGSLIAPRLRAQRPLILTSMCGALFALPLISFAALVPSWVDAVAYGAAMFGVGLLNTVWQTTMQREFPPEALARADSYDVLLSLAARPLGMSVAAPIAAAIGNAVPLLTMAALVAVVNLAIIALPDVRAMTSEKEATRL